MTADQEKERWYQEWGVDTTLQSRGAIVDPVVAPPARQIYLLQRKETSVGKNLGKTSGWVHRAALKMKGVKMMPGCEYQRVDDDGLHVVLDDRPQLLEVDNVVICAGQTPNRD